MGATRGGIGWAVVGVVALLAAGCGGDGACSSDEAGCGGPAPACGDGTLDGGEGCDDGNTSATDGCSAACQVEAGWTCGGGPSSCLPLVVCGDGVVGPGEGCDDGGTASGDGCSSSCAAEPGFTCTGQPSACVVDADGDGVTDATDDCPTLANPSQADADQDGLGDVCDACPSIPNPGGGACPVTIYQLKNGSVDPGATVSLAHALVTARDADGYFVQVKAGDPAYTAPEYSGIWVHHPSSAVAVGQRLTFPSASLQYVDGRRQLADVSPVVEAAGEAPPAPVLATPSQVMTGGQLAAALDGVLVEVRDATVSDLAPSPAPGELAPTYEFLVAPWLRVDDQFHLVAPSPVLGQGFASITGVLTTRLGESRLEPRGAADLVAIAPGLAGLEPAVAFARVGATAAPTIPTPLTVRLSRPLPTDTFVAVTSSEPSSLAVVGGGVTVPAGQASAQVLVNGLAAAAGVTLTATLDGATLEATAMVLDGTEVPSVVGLTPAASRVAPGGQRQLTVALSIPAPPTWAEVTLSVSPAAAAALPATVLVAPDTMEASFFLLNGGDVTTAVVTATLGATSARATVLSAPATGLLLNEVDYDQPVADGAEFIEILNPTAQPVFLDGVWIYLVNGSTGLAYATIDLSPAGTLAPGQYLVVASSAVSVAAGALRLEIPSYPPGGLLQNGAPDALALVDTVTGTLLDALVYEESTLTPSLRAVALAGPSFGMGPFSLVSGSAVPLVVADSNTGPGALVRHPDGARSGDDLTDWAFTATPTPGSPNPATVP